MDEKLKIGIKEFNGLEDAYNFCENEEEKNNMKSFFDTKNENINIKIKKDTKGKLLLEKGTYIHGIIFNEENLLNVKEEGLIAPEFRTNIGDTSYMRSICVFKVDKTQTIEQYYNRYSNQSKENFDEGTGCKKSYYNGVGVSLAEEGRYLPIESSNDRIAFIINPNDYINKVKKDKLNKGYPNEYKRGYEIPIGIPSNFISGIMISKGLMKNKEKIEKLKEIFPEQYVVTPEGDFIYNSQQCIEKSKPSVKDTVENMAKQENVVLENENAQETIKNLEKTNEIEKQI